MKSHAESRRMRILSVDTATVSCCVGILDDDRVLAEVTNEKRQTHSRHLMTMIDAALGMAGLRIDELDAFGVTRGPGSFTGVRIGVSTVQGLARGISKPVVGVSSLEALAHQSRSDQYLICPMMDARRGEVYTSLYRSEKQGLNRLIEETVCSPDYLARQIDGACLLVGNGSSTYREVIRGMLGDRAVFAAPALNRVRAETVGRLALQTIRNAEQDVSDLLVPHYIRPSDAETNQSKKEASRQSPEVLLTAMCKDDIK